MSVAIRTEKVERIEKYARRAAPWIAAALFVVAAFFVIRTVRRIGFDAVLRTLRALEAGDVALAALTACASYLTLTLFDWLAVRSVCTKRIPYPKVAFASFTALSLGHTVGLAVLSSGTARYRIYSHFGLPFADIARIVFFAAATVATGLATLAGVGGLTRPDAIADFAGVPSWLATSLGAGAMLAVAAYLVWTARTGGSVKVLGHRHPVPSFRVALLQVGVGCVNFVLVAATLHRLLGTSTEVTLLAFASFYAAGNAIAILSHVPGGLGVLEMVVLSADRSAAAVSALVAFRVVYYIVPFLLGALAFATFELAVRRRRGRDRS